jgi:hypothetical protein
VFRNVRPEAADEAVHAAAVAMGSLQKYPVTGISRLDEGLLENS